MSTKHLMFENEGDRMYFDEFRDAIGITADCDYTSITVNIDAGDVVRLRDFLNEWLDR